MGKMARYKKQKKVFDVDNYLFETDGEKDDPINNKARDRSFETKTKRRQELILLDSTGNPLKPRSEKDRKKKTKNQPMFEGRKPGESIEDMHNRIETEAQERIRALQQSKSTRKQKHKNYQKRKKEKKQEKKFNRAAKKYDSDSDSDTKEKQVYRKPRDEHKNSIFDVADKPPEFTQQHNLRKRKQNPNDRERFAKIVPVDQQVEPISAKRQKSEYEKHQLEALRLRVMNTYNDLKKKKHTLY